MQSQRCTNTLFFIPNRGRTNLLSAEVPNNESHIGLVVAAEAHDHRRLGFFEPQGGDLHQLRMRGLRRALVCKTEENVIKIRKCD